MIESKHYELVYQIGELLESKLDCKIKDHGLWRVRNLISDTLEEKSGLLSLSRQQQIVRRKKIKKTLDK